ncbi:MAG: hypothetical protein AAGM16_10470 [Pseudomonadota bacterium]
MSTEKKSTGVLLEGVVIVASILLAFAIDAWWDSRVESRERSALLQSIREDIIATRSVMAAERQDSLAVAARATAILEAMAGEPSEEELRETMLEIGSVFVIGGWSPVIDTYAEAVNSGRLRLIEDEALRVALFRYSAQIAELDDIFGEVSVQYYGQIEPFLVANTVYSEIAAAWWRGSLVEAPFATDFAALSQSRELWNLITFRLEMELAVQDRFDRLESRAEEVLALLANQE